MNSTILALFCNFAFPICQRTIVSQKFKLKIQKLTTFADDKVTNLQALCLTSIIFKNFSVQQLFCLQL